jgi:hypothetical protein
MRVYLLSGICVNILNRLFIVMKKRGKKNKETQFAQKRKGGSLRTVKDHDLVSCWTIILFSNKEDVHRWHKKKYLFKNSFGRPRV